ncbi:MAG TPA: hypothetical protein DEF42_07215 [Desulfosporosinus sp.]|nr:hypothetical protein [Desulfosporosinus sp.]
MNNHNNKSAIGLAVLFELILIVTALVDILSREWKTVLLVLLAMVCLILPFIITWIANLKNIMLPSSFQIITLIFIVLAQYFGEIMNFYQIFWWWDLFLHAIFGSYGVIIAWHLMRGVIRKEQETTNQRFTLFRSIVAFSFTIASGALWEILEFMGDYFFKTSMVKGGLEDTSTDLIVKILAAFITSTFCYYRILKRNNSLRLEI